MIRKECVDYYSILEILQRQDNTLLETEILAFLDANPTYGRKINGTWHSYDLGIQLMNSPDKARKLHLAGVLGFDFSDLHLYGLVLDIGAGGEGVISQATGGHVVGIAPEEHRDGLSSSPQCILKIMMDALDMKFLDDSFDTATAFFTLMYIDTSDHAKVFSETYRVLKPGGEFVLWDMVIPECDMPDKAGYMMAIEVRLKEKSILTGYGTRWAGRRQNLECFRQLARDCGFSVLEEAQSEHKIYLRLRK